VVLKAGVLSQTSEIKSRGTRQAPVQGRRGAFWALLGGPGVELRETGYDVERALERFRATGCPGIEEALRESLVDPADPDWVADLFERSAVKPRPHLADEEA
jgi:hypothetical protein